MGVLPTLPENRGHFYAVRSAGDNLQDCLARISGRLLCSVPLHPRPQRRPCQIHKCNLPDEAQGRCRPCLQFLYKREKNPRCTLSKT